MASRQSLMLLSVTALTAISQSTAARAEEDLNPYVLKAVHLIETERKNGRYNISKSYSQDLDWGQTSAVHQNPRDRAAHGDHETMCVAATAEVIIEAVNLFVKDYPDEQATVNGAENANSPYRQLPAVSWNGGSVLSIRPFLFLQGSTQNILGSRPGETPRGKDKNGNIVYAYARGTGNAFSIFHVGEELPFSELKPGDFINFNRSGGSGHSAVFLNYIDKSNHYTIVYSRSVVGFEYFSAQGMAGPHHPAPADAGFARRDAYFGEYEGGTTPSKGVSHPRDRTVIPPSGKDLLYINGGRMWAPLPGAWNVENGLTEIKKRVESTLPISIKRRGPVVRSRLTDDLAENAVALSGEDGN